MVTANIVYFSLIVAALLISASYFYKKNKVSRYLYASSGLLFVLLGILLLITPFSSVSGITITYNETYQYGNNFTNPSHWAYDTGTAPSCTNPNDPACVWLFHRYDTVTENKEYSNDSTILSYLNGMVLLLAGLYIVYSGLNPRDNEPEELEFDV